MDQASIPHEIERLERAFWDSIVDGDAPAATALLTEPALSVCSDGSRSFGHAAYADMLRDSGVRVAGYALSDMDVLVPVPGVAIVSYLAEQTVETGGERRTSRAYDTSTWVRQEGHWRCAAHTESPVPAPG